MQTILTPFFAISIFICFSCLPGAWIAYGFTLEAIRWPARLALSGALSPVLLALQVLLLKACGLPFALIPPILIVMNVPALFLLGRAFWRSKPTGVSIAALGSSALLLSILIGYVLLPWEAIQNLRPFAWHALWHTDISYALTRGSFLPEEPELAGLTLAYGWIGHLYWSVIGWSTNLPPTMTYALSNLIWLLFTFLLAYEFAVIGLGVKRPAALLSVGLTFLGTNALGALAWTVQRDWHWQQRYLGDIRYTPLLGKYLGFETMPFAFALLLAVALLSVLALRQRIQHLAIPLAVTLAGLGLIYPILFPVGCLLVGGLWLLLATRLDQTTPYYQWSELIGMAGGMVASVLFAFIFLELVTQDRSNGAARLAALSAMKPKAFHLISALLLFAPAVLPIVRSLCKRWGAALLLVLVSLGAMGLYVVADLDNLEYKYILAATLVGAPLAAAGLEMILACWPKVQWTVTFAMPLLLVLLHQALMLRVGAQIPTNLVYAPPLNESSFWISLQPDDGNAGWTTAVRTQTPENTIVVTEQSTIHVSSFVARSLYAPSDIDGEQTSGYSVDNRFNLLTWRGYPPTLYAARQAVVKTIYRTTSPAAMQDALNQLQALQRPIAIHFRAQVPMLQWLRAQGIGSALFADQGQVVWLVPPLTLPGENQYAAK